MGAAEYSKKVLPYVEDDNVRIKRLNQFKFLTMLQQSSLYCGRTNLGGTQLREVTVQ